MPWLEGIIHIEGIQDICPRGYSENSFEISFIMLYGRDVFLDILNVTVILTLPAIPHVTPECSIMSPIFKRLEKFALLT